MTAELRLCWCAALAFMAVVKCQDVKVNKTSPSDVENVEYPELNYYGDYNLTEDKSQDYLFLNSSNTLELAKDYYSLEEDDATEPTSTVSPSDIENVNSTESVINEDIVLVLEPETAHVLNSPGYPQSYPSNNNWTWIFLAGEGFGLEINVTDIDLDVASFDYLVINPGGGGMNSDSLLFTGFLSKPRNFRIMNHDNMTIQLVSNVRVNDTAEHRGFQMSVKHIGIVTDLNVTTLDPPPDWIVSPAENHTIYLSGKTPKQFLNVSEDFRKILVDMVFYYIDEHSLPVTENFTVEELVTYRVIGPCNINWPATDSCITVTYAVPLFFNKTDGEYLMTRENMTVMWDSLSSTDFYLQEMKQLGLSVYHLPNDNAVLSWWIGIFLGVVVVMLLLTYFTWRCNCFDEYKKMKPFSDADSQISKKTSDSSLFPTPHQTIPPLFGMESYDQYWLDQTLPSNYEGSYIGKHETGSLSIGGYDNKALSADDKLFFELDSDEEIVMSLPDNVPNGADGSKKRGESSF